jgi:hypothetical protein
MKAANCPKHTPTRGYIYTTPMTVVLFPLLCDTGVNSRALALRTL